MRSMFPEFSKDIVDIAPEIFASADWRVINRKGDNYYLACGEPVLENEDGSGTTCLKPKYHMNWDHEDAEGRIREGRRDPIDMDYRVRMAARSALKSSGLNDEQIYNALNALMFSGIQLIKEG